MLITIDSEKTSSICNENIQQSRNRRKVLNGIYKKSIADVVPNGKIANIFLLKLRARQILTFISLAPVALNSALKQRACRLQKKKQNSSDKQNNPDG
jgi:hypothetical protein